MKQILSPGAMARKCAVWGLAGLAGCGGWTTEQGASASDDTVAGAAQVAATGPVSVVAPTVAVVPAPAVTEPSPATASAGSAASTPVNAAATAASVPSTSVAATAAPVASTPVTAPAIPAPSTFQSQLLARPATVASDVSTTPTLSTADAQQVARLSREWAVPALWQQGTTSWTNGVVMPPLQFAWLQGVASAARGQSLAQLQNVWPAASAPPTVGAALMRGVARTVSGKPGATVIDSFVSALALDSAPGTLASFTLRALSPGAMEGDSLLRLDIADSLGASPTWAAPSAFNGYFSSTDQGSLIVPMVRVAGAVLVQGGSAYEAEGLHLGGGRWLFRVTPQQGLSPFGEQGLAGALTDLATAMIAGAANQAVAGDMVVPATVSFTGEAMDAMNGLSHALDRINADMRGLDGTGGTYLRAAKGTGGMTFTAQGFSYNASRSAQFVFEPLNIFNTYGSVSTMVNGSNVAFLIVGQQLPACPSATPDLRPSYFVLMDGNGRIEVLARMARLEGQRCQ